MASSNEVPIITQIIPDAIQATTVQIPATVEMQQAQTNSVDQFGVPLSTAPASLGNVGPDAAAPVYFHPAYNADPGYNDQAYMKDLATNQTGEGQGMGYTMTWENINCTVSSGTLFSKKHTVQALTDVSGYVRPGESLAILGASGAGKTTLVDILSGRKTTGTLTGTIHANGAPYPKNFTKKLGYVTYDMPHIPTMTVRETLMFAAEMRMPGECTKAQREERVEEVIRALKLEKCANTIIGDELLRGVSSGEKKRTEVGVEMIARPSVLVLDEPTSGLDDYGARFTMKLVLEYVKSEMTTVIVVIHQPAEAVFNLFDRCLLLGKGRVAYFGDTKTAGDYFSSMGHPTPPYMNPIEHYLNVIAADPIAAAEYYARSPLGITNTANITSMASASYPPSQRRNVLYERSWFDQFALLWKRTIQRYIRNPSTSWGRVLVFVLVAFMFGGVFFHLQNDITGIRNAASMTATFGFLPAFVAGSAVPQFLEDRDLYLTERAAAFYSTLPYWLVYLIIEGLILTVISLLMSLIVYFMSGLNPAGYGNFLAMLIMQSWVCVAMAQGIGAWSKTLVQAYTALVAYGLVLYIFSGVQVNLNQLQSGLSWVSDISFWRWTVQYMLFNNLYNFNLQCQPSAIIPLNMNTVFSKSLQPAIIGSINQTLAKNPTNDVQVNAIWSSMGGMNSMVSLNATDPPTGAALPGAPVTMNQNINALLTGIAPLTAFNVQNQTALAAAAKSVGFGNCVKAAGSVQAYPDLSFCVVGDSKKFIYNFFGVQPGYSTGGVCYQFCLLCRFLHPYISRFALLKEI